jgi:hypothetical protein
MVLLDFLQQGAEFHGLLPARLDRRLPTRGILLANIRQEFLGLRSHNGSPANHGDHPCRDKMAI